MGQGWGHSQDGPNPTNPHCAAVSNFVAGPGRAPQPGHAGGLASAAANVLAFFF